MLPSRIAWQLRSSPWRIWLARLIAASGTLSAFITPDKCGNSRGWVGGKAAMLFDVNIKGVFYCMNYEM